MKMSFLLILILTLLNQILTLVEPDIDPRPFIFLTTQVRDVLMQHDQDYFPLIRYHFNPRQKVMGWQ